MTGKLQDFSGNLIGTPANPAKVCVTLCGYGPQLPSIIGTSMIARPGPIYIESTSGTFSIPLWGNDQIVPGGTYYTVSLLDGQGNVVQCGAFQFTGSGLQDLSNASQILPPFNLGFQVTRLEYLPCNSPPRLPNNVFTAPGPPIAVAYNGVLLGAEYYTILNTQITLTFTTELGDRIDAFCII